MYMYIYIMCAAFDMRMDKSSPFLTTQNAEMARRPGPASPELLSEVSSELGKTCWRTARGEKLDLTVF